jgi:hypothetical protein
MKLIPLSSLLRRPNKKVWLTIVIVVGLTSGLFAEEAYVIKLARQRPRVGQEYQFKAELHKTESSSFESETRSQQTNSTSHIELLAHCKVLGSAEGSESTELVIQHMTERQGTNSEVLLAPGTVVTMQTIAGERFFKADRVPISLAVTKLLERFVESASHNIGCTDDQALGTSEPKKIGESWKGSADCLTKTFNKKFGTAAPNQLDVTMSLLGVEEASETKCLRFGLLMAVQTDKPIARFAKGPGSRLLSAKWDSSIHSQGTLLLPLDEDLPCLRMVNHVEAVSKVNYPSEKRPIVLEFRYTEEMTQEIKLVR